MKLKEQTAYHPYFQRASRYQAPAPGRRLPVTPRDYHSAETEPLIYVEPPRRTPWKRYFGLGMFLFLAGFLIWNLWIVPTYTNLQTQWHYGDARVSVLMEDVGHGGVSGFLAFDNGGEVIVVEIVGKPARYIVYSGLTLIGSDSANRVVNMRVEDVNGDGKPDLVLSIVGEAGNVVLFNTGTRFQWMSK